MEPLAGILVADFTRHLPGPFASRELARLGARVVRVEAPAGDPVRDLEPEWDALLNAGKESVVWDRELEPDLAPRMCARADVVLVSFRPGVAERLGIGANDLPEHVVHCSLTGFGEDDLRAGHDLNYMGWAGALAPTAPAMPPLPFADLAAGSQTAVVHILGALLQRARTGAGARIVVSMTHGAHELAQFAGPLTGSLACYRIYECADGRFLTIAALEPKFWLRLCEVLERPDLVPRQHDGHAELEALFRTRALEHWLDLFDGEDVMAGPVATLQEAAVRFAPHLGPGRPPALGEHTEQWRRELALSGDGAAENAGRCKRR